MLMICKRSYNKKRICSNKLDLEDSACHEINKQHFLSNSLVEERILAALRSHWKCRHMDEVEKTKS